jgi:hypothetical protein
MKFRRSALAIVLAALVMPFTGCSTKSVLDSSAEIVKDAHSVFDAIQAQDPGSPLLAKAEQFLKDADAFLAAYKGSASPDSDQSVALLAANLVSAFRAAILPLIAVSPEVAAAVIGIDVALRIIASRFHKTAAAALAENSENTARARAMRAAAPDLAVRIAAIDKVFTDYLALPKLH